MLPESVENLIKSFKRLPGIGEKTAQRLALHLLNKDKDSAVYIKESIINALHKVCYCEKCVSLSDNDICDICSDPKRDQTKLCVVETMLDMLAIENSNVYNGLYFVLNGVISPLDGVGPAELKLDKLKMISENVNEMVLAINPTIEGDATVYIIQEMLKNSKVTITRIAYGVPFGGELEYADMRTLSHAFSSRSSI